MLTTPRLIIRCHTPEDLPGLIAATEESRAELQQWMAWATPWPSPDETAQWLRQSIADFPDRARHIRYGGFDRDTGRFLVSLGCTTMQPRRFHISYWARTGETGKGYTTEAVRGFCDYLL